MRKGIYFSLGFLLISLLAVSVCFANWQLVFKNGSVSEITEYKVDGNVVYVTNSLGAKFKFPISEIDTDKTNSINKTPIFKPAKPESANQNVMRAQEHSQSKLDNADAKKSGENKAIQVDESIQKVYLELKNGQRIEGIYQGGAKNDVKIQVGSQVVSFPVSEVSRLSFGLAQVSPSIENNYQQAAKESLNALRAVRSVTEAGVNYQNYVQRANDAKIKVDQFLSDFKDTRGDQAFRGAIKEAMNYYTSAALVWSNKIVMQDLELVASDEYVNKCQSMVAFINSREKSSTSTKPSKKTRRPYELWDRGLFIVNHIGPSPLFSCASEKIEEAESAFKKMFSQ